MYSFLRILLAGAALGLAGALRAQITETPVTVAPGRFLLEMDALSLTLDRAGDARYTAFGAANTFLSTGLTDNWDIQVGAQLFISQKVTASGLKERNSGIGDVYVRTKWRFLEDPDAGMAVAIMPYVKLPTNSGQVGNRSMEGGIIVPWTTKLLAGFDFSAMAKLDYLRNDADDGYDTYWYASAALRRALTQAVGIYGEATLGKSSGAGSAQGVMGGGVTIALSDRISWDLAAYRGISNAAADWNHVVRLNWAF